MKKLLSVLLVCFMVFTLCSCGQEPTSTNTTTEPYILPTTIIDADISLPYTSSDPFEPYSARSNYNRDLIFVLYESLYDESSDGKGARVLASSESAEGTKVTVTLRSGVLFSDGSEMTSAHIEESFNKAKNNDYYKASLSNISSLTVVDNYTVVFNLYKEDPLVLNTLNFPVVKVSGDEVIGSGKYFVDYLEDIPFLAVNTNHRAYSSSWNKQVALYDMAGISSPIYPFKANEISVYRNDLTGGEYTNLSSVTVSEKMNNLVYVGVNSVWAGTVVSNSWFRQVINIGINRINIASKSFLGQADAVSTIYREDCFMLDGVTKPSVSGDTMGAVAILEQNGYKEFSENGIRTNGATELKVTILVCGENQYKVAVAEAVKESLEALGIGVSINEQKTVEDYTAVLEEGYFDLYIGETVMASDYGAEEFFTENGALSYGVNEDFRNKYSLYENGESTFSDFMSECYNLAPVIPLFYRKAVISINPNVVGYSDSGHIYSSVCNWKLN